VVGGRGGFAGGGVGARDVEQRASRGRGDGDGAREAVAIGEARDCWPGYDSGRDRTPVAGGDEGDAGGQGVLDRDRGGIRGPVVGDGDGVGEVLAGIDGGGAGLGELQVGELVDSGGSETVEVSAVVVVRVVFCG